MRESNANLDSGGVQDVTSSEAIDAVSTRRYTVGPDEPLDVAIVYAVAAMKGVGPMELENPLHDVVDADALRQLFASADESLSATIFVDGHRVSIVAGGEELIVSKQ